MESKPPYLQGAAGAEPEGYLKDSVFSQEFWGVQRKYCVFTGNSGGVPPGGSRGVPNPPRGVPKKKTPQAPTNQRGSKIRRKGEGFINKNNE